MKEMDHNACTPCDKGLPTSSRLAPMEKTMTAADLTMIADILRWDSRLKAVSLEYPECICVTFRVPGDELDSLAWFGKANENWGGDGYLPAEHAAIGQIDEYAVTDIPTTEPNPGIVAQAILTSMESMLWIDKKNLNQWTREQLFRETAEVLLRAEGPGGPEGDEYVRFMSQVQAYASQCIENFKSWNKGETNDNKD